MLDAVGSGIPDKSFFFPSAVYTSSLLFVSSFMMLTAADSARASAASFSRACSCLLSTNAQDSSDT